ncbi:hypothetical protein CUMW_250640 [Citrus unshiu]|uniref:Uncharacterized protein n=1 Tax=Citrus unshiu TaxID=55188 RepID=A0A2H5QPX3_CITUN|nr:hypothetical protein CUMW_250640 [Citrus unshiu]
MSKSKIVNNLPAYISRVQSFQKISSFKRRNFRIKSFSQYSTTTSIRVFNYTFRSQIFQEFLLKLMCKRR